MVVELSITDFEFSPEFSKTIESKQTAEQLALKAKRDLDRIKVEAQQRIATAQARPRRSGSSVRPCHPNSCDCARWRPR